MTDYSKFTNAGINDVIAERVMGWFVRDGERDYWYCPRTEAFMRKRDWDPAMDHNDAATVRAEIRRGNLETEFADHLARLVCEYDDESVNTIEGWRMVDADPRQQCIAALQAVEGREAG